ncbi:MAG: acyl-ACP thioesterase [Clostridiales bacterium]|nr:acyl-ACP thioesterase [Clostridiales bacterium]
MSNKIFTEEYKIRFYDVDCKYRLKPETILAWAGELAGDHLRSKNITREQMWEDGQVFLLTRCIMRYNKTPRYHDSISMNTWEYGTKGVQFNRLYDITDEDGNVCIESHSLWVLVNPQTHRILRPKEYAYEMDKADKNLNISTDKIVYKQGDFVGNYKFLYSDLDANGHVNNGAYVRLAQSYCPMDIKKRDIFELDISFIKEAMEGDEIKIFSKVIDEITYQIYGEFQDGKHSFEAQIKLR